MLGAGGPTGTECLKRLAELGIVARAVVRTPDKYNEKLKAIDPKVTFILAMAHLPNTHMWSAGDRLRLWQAMSLNQRVLRQRCKGLVAQSLPPVDRLSFLQAPWTSRCLPEPAEVLWVPAAHKIGCVLGNDLSSCRALPMWRQLAKLQALSAWFWSALHWSLPKTGIYTSLLCSLPDLTQTVATGFQSG